MGWRKTSKVKFAYDKSKKYRSKKIPVESDSKKWSDKKYNKLKFDIKFHYSVVQDNICAYCREPIHFNGYGDPIEHIAPKSRKPKWMFHPTNLCLSCYGCNTKKSITDILKDGESKYGNEYDDIPKSSDKYIILHVHFDIFSDFIKQEGIIFKENPKDKTGKGRETIKVCSLNRLDLLYTRAKRARNSKKNITDLAMDMINNPNSSKEDIKYAKNLIKNLIKRYKYWKELHG